MRISARFIWIFILGFVAGALFADWSYPGRATSCATDTECAQLCQPDDTDCDGGPQQ